MERPRVARIIRLTLTGLTVGYLVVIVIVGMSALQSIDWTRYVSAMLLGFALYPLSIVTMALAWALAAGFLRRLDWELAWDDVQAFAWSFMLRRLPGGIWQIAGRVVTYRGQNTHASQPIAASVAELGLSTIAAGSLYLAFGLLPHLGTLADVGLALAVTMGAGAIVGQVVGRLPWIQRATPATGSPAIGSSVYVAIGLLYLVGYGVASWILDVMVVAGGAVGFGIENAAGVWGLATLISTVILLVPIGMGIREVTLTVLLSPFIGRLDAVVVAVLLRLLYVVGDLAWGAALVAGTNWVATIRRHKRAQSG